MSLEIRPLDTISVVNWYNIEIYIERLSATTGMHVDTSIKILICSKVTYDIVLGYYTHKRASPMHCIYYGQGWFS